MGVSEDLVHIQREAALFLFLAPFEITWIVSLHKDSRISKSGSGLILKRKTQEGDVVRFSTAY